MDLLLLGFLSGSLWGFVLATIIFPDKFSKGETAPMNGEEDAKHPKH